jgi:hypothetical protein
MEVGKTKCSPEQIRTAVSRFLFSFVIEIQSLKSLAQQAYLGDWPLDSAPYSLVKLKNTIRPGFVDACMYVCIHVWCSLQFVRSFFRSVKDDTFIHTRYVHHARATIQTHKRLLFDVTVSCLFLSSQDHIPNEPSFSYKE